jgi:hypothetical protein
MWHNWREANKLVAQANDCEPNSAPAEHKYLLKCPKAMLPPTCDPPSIRSTQVDRAWGQVKHQTAQQQPEEVARHKGLGIAPASHVNTETAVPVGYI